MGVAHLIIFLFASDFFRLGEGSGSQVDLGRNDIASTF